jgi:hypothetical protein
MNEILVYTWGSRTKRIKRHWWNLFKEVTYASWYVIRSVKFVNDYEFVLDFGERVGSMRHEFSYNTITRTGNKIKLTAKPDHLTNP